MAWDGVISRTEGGLLLGIFTIWIGFVTMAGLRTRSAGTAASIHPITAPPTEIAITVGLGLVSVLLMFPGSFGIISHGRSMALLGTYAAFIGLSLAFA